MGLSICLGVLDKRDTWDDDVAGETIRGFRRSFRRLNTFLRRKGLPPHHEPERPPEMSPFNPDAGLRYKQLHCLRRFAANHYAHPGRLPKPIKQVADSAGDRELRKYYDSDPEGESARSHLISHSDCSGFYTRAASRSFTLASSFRRCSSTRCLPGPAGTWASSSRTFPGDWIAQTSSTLGPTAVLTFPSLGVTEVPRRASTNMRTSPAMEVEFALEAKCYKIDHSVVAAADIARVLTEKGIADHAAVAAWLETIL